MAQPTAYVPSFDFSDFSTLNPDVPQPGVSLDAQFNAIALTTNQIRANLALIQRDDGLLANGIVTPDSLSDELYAGISRAIPWATATDYLAGDLVWYLSILYSANDDHTSTTNPTIDTGNWTEILDMTATVPDVITQEAQDAADAAAASALAAEASAAGVTSIVGSISYLWAGTATGAANTLVLTPVPPMASYAVGHKLRFLVGTTNTGAVTMDTDNALGSTTIKKSIGGALVALAPGDLIAGTIAEIEYVSALAGYQLINPPTYSQGSDVASATTVNLDTTNGDYVSITGTTTITGITLAQGRERTVTFAGSLTLTHGAGLILKNKGSNILTAAGDSAVFRGEAAGVVRMVSYERASGKFVPRGFIDGFQMSTAGASATMTIGAGQATDSTGTLVIENASIATKTTSAWASGSGNGGLDAGTIANATWYSFYTIFRNDTGAEDKIFSLAPGTSSTITVTVATPAVVTWTGHGLVAGTPVKFTTTGALPTGLTAGTQYYVIATGLTANAFQVSTSIGGAAVDTTGAQSGVHTCAANPVLPANYTYFRRIGSGLTNGSAQWTSFIQVGDRFEWVSPILDHTSATNPGTSAATVALNTPNGISTTAFGAAFGIQTGVNNAVYLSALDTTDLAAVSNAAPLSTFAYAGVAGENATSYFNVRTNTSRQIRARVQVSDAGALYRISTHGWYDMRGKL